MQHIYAPWRAKYFESFDEKGCPFCAISLNPSDDEENFVFFRDEVLLLRDESLSLHACAFSHNPPRAQSLPHTARIKRLATFTKPNPKGYRAFGGFWRTGCKYGHKYQQKCWGWYP